MPNFYSRKFDYINLQDGVSNMIIQGIQLKITDAEKRFVSWLITQANSQGRLYKPYVANRYAACLRSEPLKLDIPFSIEERNVYRCYSIQDFDRLEETFRGAHNFQEIDRGWGHGTFSASLSAYRRYICYLESSDSGEMGEKKQFDDLGPAENEIPSFNGKSKRVDFTNPDACAGCDPVSCVVEGKVFSVHNWRDILTELTEYFLATKPKAQELTWRSIYQRGERPFLLRNRPDGRVASRQISNGYWIYLNLSISNLVFAIGRLCIFCSVNHENVDIRYIPKRIGSGTASANFLEAYHETPIQQAVVIPDVLLEALKKNYSGGFRFETTYINLLANASGVCIDESLKAELKRHMFKRKDDIFFLIDQVSDRVTRNELLSVSTAYLHEYGCFEISELYRQFENRLNCICIRNAEDFEFFYQQIAQSGVRCVAAPQVGNRIARYSNGNVQTAFEMVAKKIVSFITESCYGSCTEDDLHNKFQAFSTDLLSKIIRIFAEDGLIRVEINDSICFQSFEALGLPLDFADILITILDRLEGIGLSPSQEVLHTAISLELGINFKAEFSLPEWNTFRRLIASYYKGEPRREWRNNVFGEVER